MSLRRLSLASVTFVGTSGCFSTPYAELHAAHRDGEALCRASSAEEVAVVIPEILAPLRASWRVRRVRREELSELDEATATDLFDRFFVVVVETEVVDPKGAPTRHFSADSGIVSIEAGQLTGASEKQFAHLVVQLLPKTAKPLRVSSEVHFKFFDDEVNHCKGAVSVTLEGEPFAPEAWPDPTPFKAFPVDTWSKAHLDGSWRNGFVGHDLGISVPAPAR